VPAFSPFFLKGRVLRIAADRHGHVTGDTNIAADKIQCTGFDRLEHHIWAGEAPDADDGFVSQLLNTLDQRVLRRIVLEARQAGTVFPRALRKVPIHPAGSGSSRRNRAPRRLKSLNR